MNSQPLQSWGTCDLRLKLSGATLQLTGLSASQCASLRDTYPAFVSETSHNSAEYDDIVCCAYRLEHAPTISIEELTLDGLYSTRKTRWPDKDGIDVTGFNFEAQIGLKSPQAFASLGVVEEQELAQADVIENFLRVYAAHRALQQGGVVLHSAGFVFDGKAYIFSGRSNAGKTTLTRKAFDSGAWVLSDDINLLLPCEIGYEAHAVPFTGEFGRTLQHLNGQKSYPVAGIALLEQADQLETALIKPSSAVARLLVGCPFVNTDPEESAALFDVVTALVEKVPVIILRNRRDDTIEKIMDAVMSEFNHA